MKTSLLAGNVLIVRSTAGLCDAGSLFLVALFVSVVSQAEIINWTNSNNGNWSITNNWNPRRAPSTNDIAVITNNGTYTVTLNVDPTIAGLIIGGQSGTQTVATAGRVLTLNGDGVVNTNGRILLSGGSLSGTNQIVLAGAMTWQYGSIDTNTVVSVNAGGLITMASGGSHAKLLYGSLTNGGVITWQPLGNFNIGGSLHILEGGVFDAQVNGNSITKSGADAVIINDSVFRKSTGGDLSCYVPVLNRGTIDTQTGTLILQDGSILEDGCAFTGAGSTQLNDGTNTLLGAVRSENLVFAGEAVAGSGSIEGNATWRSGQLNGDASLTVATNSTLLLSSTANFGKLFYGNLTNAGTITWQPQGGLSIGGVFRILPGALFDAQVDNISILKSNGVAIIINDGIFRKSSGSYTVACGVPMINNGITEILPGTLQFNDSCVNELGTISLAGGTFQTTQPFCLSGGLLTGWGSVNGGMTNAGTIRPSRTNGVLTINGNFVQALSGNTEFELAGNLPGTNQSRLNITGSATLRGTVGVDWANGYVPEPGTNFQVMTFASRVGEFDCQNGFILLGQGRRLTAVYSPTLLTLATVASPEPTEVPLGVTVADGSALVAWPMEFTGYDLYCATNLSQTNWTLIPGATNHFLEGPPLLREKFFRLRKP